MIRTGQHHELRRFQRTSRSAIATVELAVCLPVLAIFVFGTIEFSNAIFVQQGLTSAAYEAGNILSADGGTSATATTRAQAVLSGLNVRSATVTISPAVTSTTPTGTVIEVTCTAPFGSNSVTSSFFKNVNVTARYTVARL